MNQRLFTFRKQLGKTNIFPTPIGFGTDMYPTYMRDGKLPSIEDRLQYFRVAVKSGINYIDTAPTYQIDDYNAQAEVGMIAKESSREDLYITTKSQQEWVEDPSVNRDNLCRSFEKSLKFLNTDYVDGYLLHDIPIVVEYPNAIKECVDEMHRLKESGSIRGGIGVGIGGEGFEVVGAILEQDWIELLQVGNMYNVFNSKMIDYFPVLREKQIGFINCQIFVSKDNWDPQNALNFHSVSLSYSIGSSDVGLTIVGMSCHGEVDSNVSVSACMSIYKSQLAVEGEDSDDN